MREEQLEGQPHGGEEVDYNLYYFPAAAAQRLSNNSGKPVSVDTVRQLGMLGVLRKIKANNRMNMYLKEDVDAYVVEDRGVKAGKAQKQKRTKQ